MNNELREYLALLRECTLELIGIVEAGEIDVLEKKIDEREKIIDSIRKLSFTKKEINLIAEELEIDSLYERLINLINNEKMSAKELLKENAIKKNATSNYNKNLYNNMHIFSKKV